MSRSLHYRGGVKTSIGLKSLPTGGGRRDAPGWSSSMNRRGCGGRCGPRSEFAGGFPGAFVSTGFPADRAHAKRPVGTRRLLVGSAWRYCGLQCRVRSRWRVSVPYPAQYHQREAVWRHPHGHECIRLDAFPRPFSQSNNNTHEHNPSHTKRLQHPDGTHRPPPGTTEDEKTRQGALLVSCSGPIFCRRRRLRRMSSPCAVGRGSSISSRATSSTTPWFCRTKQT